MLCQGCERTVRFSLNARNQTHNLRSASRDISTSENTNSPRENVADLSSYSSSDSEYLSTPANTSHETFATSLRYLLQAASHGCYMCKSSISQYSSPIPQKQLHLKHLRNNKDTDVILTSEATTELDERGHLLFLDHKGGLTIDGQTYTFCTNVVYLLQPCDAAPVRPILGPPKVRSSTGDEAVLRLLQTWLSDCLINHTLCPESISADLPSRLIDTKANGFGNFQVVDVSPSIGNPRYFTLSHRWSYDTPRLRQDNADRYRTGVAWRELPGLYQDAFRLVNALGHRYIWIDSLCIFQDDRLDMLNEGLAMAAVYSHAICNIVANEGQTDRLFAIRHPALVDPYVEIPGLTRCVEPCILRLEAQGLWDREVQGSPIACRGWVLQEQLLAPRTLYFGADEVFWDCRTGRRSESFPLLAEVYTQDDRDSSLDWGRAARACMGPLWSWDAPLSRFVRSANALSKDHHASKNINSGVAYDFWYVSIPTTLALVVMAFVMCFSPSNQATAHARSPDVVGTFLAAYRRLPVDG